MSQARLAGQTETPDFYRRIGYDPARETQAFRRLAEADFTGSKAAFRKLVSGLKLEVPGVAHGPVILLLLDVLQRVNRKVHRPETDESAYHDIRASLAEQFSRYAGAEEARKGFLTTLGQLLTPLTVRERKQHPLVDRARSYIDEHYNRRLSLSSVANRLHVSPNYLSRLFRRETGGTITSHIQRVRLEHAMLLLAEGKRSISEIAYLVGYQNYRDFYRNFVKYEKASPREVQRRLQPDADSES